MAASFPYVRGGSVFQKPPRGSFLNPDHPYVNNLLLAVIATEGSVTAIRDLSLQFCQAITPGAQPAPFWGLGRAGPALDFGAGSAEVRFHPTKAYFSDVINPFSCFTVIYPTNNGGVMWSCGQQTDSNSTQGFAMSGGKLALGDNSNPLATSTLTVTTNVWNTAGISQSSGTARVFTLGGTSATNTSTVTTSAIGNGQPYSLGQFYSNSTLQSGDGFQGRMECLYLWKVAIGVQALLDLNTNPYQMFLPPTSRRYFVFAKPKPAGGYKFNPAWAARSNRFLGGGVFH